jgi:3-isopropylmalate/(R)-2-methylmalate dehydratase small subunit
MTITSRVWKLGADVDTDALAPGAYMKNSINVIAQHCLEALRPDFATAVKPGDVVVAGSNFGIGSSREEASGTLVHLGIRAVIAPSFSGLFFRNAFNLGLLLLTCPEAERLQEGDLVTLVSKGVQCSDGTILYCEPIPDFLMAMIHARGLMNVLKQRSLGKLHE